MAAKRTKSRETREKIVAKPRKTTRKPNDTGGKTLLAGAAIGSAAIAAAVLFMTRKKKPGARRG